MNQGQYGARDSGTYLLSSPARHQYNWYCMLFLIPKGLQVNSLLTGAASTFNAISKSKGNKDRFDAGEVHSEESKHLSYHISGT